MSTDPLHWQSRTAIRATAAWMEKANYKAIQVQPRGKAPVHDGWSHTDVDKKTGALVDNYVPPTVESWANNNYNIGIITGPKRGGPVDIDIDDTTCATAYAEAFLPRTEAIFGRPSKQRAHRLYRVEEPELAKTAFLDPVTKETIIEFRADGHQTVMPGSIHVSGELIMWSETKDPQVAHVRAEDLLHDVRKVAMATLIHNHLWVEGQRNEVSLCIAGMLFYYEWPEAEALNFIRTICEVTQDTETDGRLINVRRTFDRGRQNKKIQGATKLKSKEICEPAVIDRILEWLGPTAQSVVMEMNERFACVLVEGKFRIAHTDVEPGRPILLQHKDDFIEAYFNEYTVDPQGKRVKKAPLWLASPSRRQYKRVEYVPGAPPSDDFLNLWTGWAVEPSEKGSCEAWKSLLFYILCGEDEDLYNWMLSWFAHMFQFPAVKAHTCPVIIGIPGAGKTLLFSYLAKILGMSYIQVTNAEHVQGRFNHHLSQTLLLHADEALYGRERKHRAVLKSLVTDANRMNEQKGIDAKFVPSYLRLAITSNYYHAAPVEERDRRYTIVDMGTRKVDKELKDAVVQEMNTTGPARLLHFLLNEVSVDLDVVNMNVKTDAHVTSYLDLAEPAVAWWHDILQSGQLLPVPARWAQRPTDEDWPTSFGTEMLYRYFIETMKASGQHHGLPNKQRWATELHRMLGKMALRRKTKVYPLPEFDIDDKTGPVPRWIQEMTTTQRSITNLPPLKRCRELFQEHLGQTIDWEDEKAEFEPSDTSKEPAKVTYRPNF